MSKLQMKEISKGKPQEEKGPKDKTTIMLSPSVMEDLRILSWYRRSNNSVVVEEVLKEYFHKTQTEIKKAKEVLSQR